MIASNFSHRKMPNALNCSITSQCRAWERVWVYLMHVLTCRGMEVGIYWDFLLQCIQQILILWSGEFGSRIEAVVSLLCSLSCCCLNKPPPVSHRCHILTWAGVTLWHHSAFIMYLYIYMYIHSAVPAYKQVARFSSGGRRRMEGDCTSHMLKTNLGTAIFSLATF